MDKRETRKKVKRDSLGRRSDRVKRREAEQMRNRAGQNYTPEQIAKEFGRDLRTVKAHLRLPAHAEGDVPWEVTARREVLAHRFEEHEAFLVFGLEQLRPVPCGSDLPFYYDLSKAEPEPPGKERLESGLEVRDTLALRCLSEHLGSDDDLWSRRTGWEQATFVYRETSSRLWAELVERARRETGLPLRYESRSSEPLITHRYVAFLFDEAAQAVSGLPSPYGPEYFREPLSDAGEELFQLMFEGFAIAMGGRAQVIRAHQVHQQIRSELPTWPPVSEVREARQRADQSTKSPNELIELKSLQRAFPGGCQVCRAWGHNT